MELVTTDLNRLNAAYQNADPVQRRREMYEKYAEARDRKGLNDNQVAKTAGISRSTFTEWKHGRSKPKTDKLVKIAAVLGCSVMDLIEA